MIGLDSQLMIFWSLSSHVLVISPQVLLFLIPNTHIYSCATYIFNYGKVPVHCILLSLFLKSGFIKDFQFHTDWVLLGQMPYEDIKINIQVTYLEKSFSQTLQDIFNVFEKSSLISICGTNVTHVSVNPQHQQNYIYSAITHSILLIHLTVDTGYGFFHSFMWIYIYFSKICGHIFLCLRQRWMEVK